MANVLIVYGSTTGNTASVAERIAKILSGEGHTVTVLDVVNAKADNLCNNQDCVIFGCSTWGDMEIELQSDFISLFDSFDRIGVNGCKTACFGCGDSGYTHFCGAVDVIEERLEELGAVNIINKLKIDGDPDASEDEIDAWARSVLAAL
ncbi:MAG: flavodoxin [Desulfovibrio sp.]|jgi:flavodoxin short chain|nr:flavodoxin [Desulfovibrio sp.]